MPRTTTDKLLKQLQQRPAGVAAFAYGDDEHLRDETVSAVVDAMLDPATRDFNLDQLRGGDADPEGLASMLATPPMMAEHRVVVIRDAQQLSPKVRDVLLTAVQQVPAGLALVLSAAIPKGSKAKFYKTLQEAAWSIECNPIDPLDVPGWLVEKASEAHDKTLEIDAARALGQGIGNDLRMLSTELQKLVAYAGERETLSLEDVRAVGGYLPRVDRWAWFDLVGERKMKEARSQLPVLLESGESGVGLIIGMGTQLLRVGLVVAGGREALARELKPYQKWLAQRIAPHASKWTLPEIDSALGELLRTDRLLKSGGLSERQLMEELMLRLQAVGTGSERAA